MKVGIIGASGYTGAELLRLLAGHPDTEVAYITANTYRGTRVADLYPHLSAYGDALFESFDAEQALVSAELHFVALPHAKAMEVVPLLYEGGSRVIDLSADYRLDSAETYEKWYGASHNSPELLAEAVYGLPELFREDIMNSRLVAVPGCYPTAVTLALAPLLKKGLVDPKGLIADAKSGVSGAGRSLTLGSHFAQCNENISPYGLGVHRHLPEMEMYLGKICGAETSVVFSPHLVPMNRGILATCYGRLLERVTTPDLLKIYAEFYEASPFITVLEEGQLPQSKSVQGSNFCHISPLADLRTSTAIAVSAIDNLVKGASGAAIQCMNLMTGLHETAGLTALPVFP